MAKTVMIEELSKGVYLVNQNSSLISMITFGYSVHILMIESEIYDNNEWFDFIHGINLKISDSLNDVLLLNEHEINLISEWMDWVCRVIIESNGNHHSNKFIKEFLSNCDYFFSIVKLIIVNESSIIIEKSEKKR